MLNFAVKLALRRPDDVQVQSLASFVLEMARFDLSHDLRDRARFMTAMLGLATADEGVDEAALLALNAKAGQVCGFVCYRPFSWRTFWFYECRKRECLQSWTLKHCGEVGLVLCHGVRCQPPIKVRQACSQ